MESIHFQHFKSNISQIQLPEKFTFPFYYEPHLLAKIASNEIQKYLEIQKDFNHDFGLEEGHSDSAIGKMFGVLVVKNTENKLGYLAAFSGKLDDKSLPKKFVPPVFNMRTEGSFYTKGEAKIDEINSGLSAIIKDDNYRDLKDKFQQITLEINTDLEVQRKKMKVSKTKLYIYSIIFAFFIGLNATL